MRRHVDHIRSRCAFTTSIATSDDWVHIPVPTAPASATTAGFDRVDQPLCRSTRVTHPPDRFSQ